MSRRDCERQCGTQSKTLTSLALLCALFASHANATVITYDVTNVSGNTRSSNLFANLELASLLSAGAAARA